MKFKIRESIDALSYNNDVNKKKYKNKKNTYLIAPNPGSPQTMAMFNNSVGDATGMGCSSSGGCGESLEEALEWEEVLEMQDEDGTPTCYSKKLSNGEFIWVTSYPNGWIIELDIDDYFTPIKQNNGKEKVFKSSDKAIDWVDKNEDLIIDKYF